MTEWEDRRSGGAGAATHPLTNGEYRDQMRKIQRMAALDSED